VGLRVQVVVTFGLKSTKSSPSKMDMYGSSSCLFNNCLTVDCSPLDTAQISLGFRIPIEITLTEFRVLGYLTSY